MRNKIITSFLILFTLYLAGSGITMLYLYKTTSNLQSVISLHRVEIIRQDLVINAQTVQSHLYSFGTAFGQELDQIVDNVLLLDDTASKCLSCHHSKEITERLEEVVSLVDQYQDALSYLITTSANKDRIERLRMVAIGIGATLLDKVQDMALIAGQRLNDRSVQSLKEINNSRIILIITLVASLFIAVGIGVSMTRQITEPIDELVDATRHIKAGELGYATHYKSKGEFGELIRSFNEMSQSLDTTNRKIMKHISSLSNLYSITLGFHSIADEAGIYRELANGAAELVGAEQCGLMLLRDGMFEHVYPAVGLDRQAVKMLSIPAGDLNEVYNKSNRRAHVINGDISSSPMAEADRKLNVKNMMLVWLRQKGELIGALRVANKRGGDFTAEDIHPLAILANNVSVALENASLYDDLRGQMKELQSAQEQLVQAAKLVAIGELASNVAHEINNPLTTVLGYANLIKEEDDMASVVSDVQVIEKECLRAKGIVKQLLEFARKRPMHIKEVDLNQLIGEVLELAKMQIKSDAIRVEQDFGSDVTILGDENQLKQVFINITTNAFHAMGDAGTLTIRTMSEGNNVTVTLADTGEGIPEEHITRIFEPFFSTKKDKGTGIGLSVSYKIIQTHQGSVTVQSKPGEGTTFTVRLPKKTGLSATAPGA